MRLSFYNGHLNNVTLYSMAIILGILWWSIASELNRASRTFTVPICFYNTESNTIKAPEIIRITLGGKRSHLRLLNDMNVAVHIDAQTIPEKTTVLKIKQEHLLLPQNIKLLSYSPSNPLVTREKTT